MKLSSKDRIINDSSEEKLALARSLRNSGNFQGAIEMYHKVLFLKENIDALVEMAEIYEKIMDVSTAVLFYRRSLQIMPRHDIK